MSKVITIQVALDIFNDILDEYFDSILQPLFLSVTGGLEGRLFAEYGYEPPETTFGFWSNGNPWSHVSRGDLGLVVYRILREADSLPLWLSFPFSTVDVSRPEGPYPHPGIPSFQNALASALAGFSLAQTSPRVRGRFRANVLLEKPGLDGVFRDERATIDRPQYRRVRRLNKNPNETVI